MSDKISNQGRVTTAQSAQTAALTSLAQKTRVSSEVLFDAAFEKMETLKLGANPLLLKTTSSDQALGLFRDLANRFLKGVSAEGAIADEFHQRGEGGTLTDLQTSDFFSTQLLRSQGNEVGRAIGKASDAYLSQMQQRQLDAMAKAQASPVAQWCAGQAAAPLMRQLAPLLRQALGSVSSNQVAADSADPAAAHQAEHDIEAILSSPTFTDPLRALVSQHQASLPSLANMDIDELVQSILLACSQDAEKGLRDEMTVMAKSLEAKRAQRELIRATTELKDQAKQKLQLEYNTLFAEGLVSGTFDAYAAQRPVAVKPPETGTNAAGDPIVLPGSVELTDPSWVENPNSIPPSLRKAPDVSTDAGQAAVYGLPADLIGQLRSYWETIGAPNTDFNGWLSSFGVHAATSADDAKKNLDAIRAKLSGSSSSTHHTRERSDLKTLDKPNPYQYAGAPPSAPARLIAAANDAQPDYQPMVYDAQQQAPAGFTVSGLASLDNAIADAKAGLDTLGDQTALEQIRMQGLVEARARTIETLSNLIKSVGKVRSQIIDNLK